MLNFHPHLSIQLLAISKSDFRKEKGRTYDSLELRMKPTLIFRFLLSLSILCLLNLKTKAGPTYVGVLCQNETSYYNLNGTYHTNLKALFSVLSSNATRINGFYNSTAGRNPPDIAYGLFLCRGDVTPDVCNDCVTTAGKQVVEKCPRLKATIWYDQCMLRHSNESFFSIPNQTVWLIFGNPQKVTDPDGFKRVLIGTLNGIASRAPNGNGMGKRFAVGEANYSSIEKLYSLAQCTQDVAISDCSSCLVQAISGLAGCCVTDRGAQVLFPSCSMRFELYRFYNVAAALPPSPTTTPGENGGVSSQLLIGIIVPVGVSVLLFIAGFYFLARRRAKSKYDAAPNEDNVVSGMEATESLQYSLSTIQAATNNFSNDNKIGEGGFGGVYKGTLRNGQEIAVKRLSQNSGQGAKEFKNEIVLVAQLQHRNLVRLLGFCLERGEKILIYEFVPNKSLDYFIFDSLERVKLNWSIRYKIIGGIARGMLYLHEESRLRIIHRDLKASNVLLDRDMNAKVSDFGMARIFGVDQTQGNTNKVVGTYGYMSPEYAMHGEFSVKSDVYSFGVLVLEIISGQKSNNFYQSGYAEDLPSYAWKLWRDKRPLELMDLALEGSYSRSEVTRCIHIALLCVQEDPSWRPSMATVVLMLNSYSLTMSLPQQPAFFSRTKAGFDAPKDLALDTSTSKSMQWSVNEVSVTELDPR